MTARPLLSSGALAVWVKEPSPGLFFWVVTQASADAHTGDVCIDASDHPYPTHDAALRVGAACLKAHQATADAALRYQPTYFTPAAAHRPALTGN
ncbi:MAG: hypothetical protein JWR60_1764 [Polaromonas sp.]|nr:hypothetical protein [Polaromonas sp.]